MLLQTQEDVIRAVREIELEYRVTPGLILSECDAQCLLFMKLRSFLEQTAQSQIQTDVEGVLASPIHTEINFIDSNGKLSIRPDIVVMNEGSLSLINDDESRLIDRKGFVFYGSALLIEIKFCKSSNGIDLEFTNRIKNDCLKLDEISQNLYPVDAESVMSGCVVVFNKTNLKCNEFDELMRVWYQSNTSKIIYATAQFSPSV